MEKHKTVSHAITERKTVEMALLKRFPAELDIFKPLVDYPVVDRFKDGSYGLSSTAFALYSNGHNVRGKSDFAPFGLIYHDNETIFSLGYFRKEGDPLEKPGYLIIVSPRGINSIEKVRDFVDSIPSIPLSGVCVRYLKFDQYLQLLNSGWLPAKEHPWHSEAPEEDESLTNGVIDLKKIIKPDGSLNNLTSGGNNNHRRNFRLHCNRFSNFLRRNNLTYELRKLEQSDTDAALQILETHFQLLRSLGKAIGSTMEDHLNSISPRLISVPGVDAKIGFLDDVPVSLFVYEKLTDTKVGIYTTFTSRDKETVLTRLGIIGDDLPIRLKAEGQSCVNSGVELTHETGFSAMPIYAYSVLFRDLLSQGIDTVHLGGSEHPDLNLIKRHMGGEPDPTYWAVKLL
ncbi:MAG: hypothetical protein Q7S22_01775 [Candidatus Micrarchaeota archaeon]|nr:hypothetical protein [Candidatus Micrarchaeota archaeon]